MNFSELKLPEPVLSGIRDHGFETCTPIQAMTLPRSLQGKDVAGQAKTGTGKTAAYLIACFTRLLKSKSSADNSAPSHGSQHGSPRALIVAPTRELVVQIERDARSLGAHVNLEMLAVYGGLDYEQQRARLKTGCVDILIGTMGRLIDYFKQKAYRLSKVEVLVIDEADLMFDMGFIPDLRYMLRRLPKPHKRLSLLFSATLSYRAQELSYEFMNHPEVISPDVGVQLADQVVQSLYHVTSKEKIALLVNLLKAEVDRAMVFVNTKRMAERLKPWLNANKIVNGYLSGDVPQVKRLKVLQRFQRGDLPVLIATDVAGRGLHVEGVTHVINYDLPEDPENYLHRIGRTARAGKEGDAISLVDEEGVYRLEAIESYIGTKIPVLWAEETLMKSPVEPKRSSFASHSAAPKTSKTRSKTRKRGR